MALAEDAAATKPNRASRLGPLCSHHQPLLPTDPRTTPNALSPLRRHHPREEPGALAAHAGICAGGDRKRSSLPRPSSVRESITSSAVASNVEKRRGPSRPRARNASAALQNFVTHPQKTF